jgi:hypothetical protein
MLAILVTVAAGILVADDGVISFYDVLGALEPNEHGHASVWSSLVPGHALSIRGRFTTRLWGAAIARAVVKH